MQFYKNKKLIKMQEKNSKLSLKLLVKIFYFAFSKLIEITFDLSNNVVCFKMNIKRVHFCYKSKVAFLLFSYHVWFPSSSAQLNFKCFLSARVFF